MMDLDFISVFVGYFICLFCDVIFSIANYFVQRAHYYRNLKKHIERDK